MKKQKWVGILIFVPCFSFQVLAAIPKRTLPFPAVKTFLSEGSFRGGKAGIGFSLLGVKRVFSATGNSERLILEMGDREGKPYSGKLGYFHAQLFRNPSELSLDLSQLVKSRVTSTHLKKLIQKSKLIQNAELLLDKADHSTHMAMRFKVPVKMRVFTLSPKNKSPKLVIDITKI